MSYEAKMDHQFKIGDAVRAADHPTLRGTIVSFRRWPGWSEDVARVCTGVVGEIDWWRGTKTCLARNEPTSVGVEDAFREAASELLAAFAAEGHPSPRGAVYRALGDWLFLAEAD